MFPKDFTFNFHFKDLTTGNYKWYVMSIIYSKKPFEELNKGFDLYVEFDEKCALIYIKLK